MQLYSLKVLLGRVWTSDPCCNITSLQKGSTGLTLCRYAQARDDAVDSICKKEIGVYSQIFSGTGETAALDRTERRYAWLRNRFWPAHQDSSIYHSSILICPTYLHLHPLGVQLASKCLSAYNEIKPVIDLQISVIAMGKGAWTLHCNL